MGQTKFDAEDYIVYLELLVGAQSALLSAQGIKKNYQLQNEYAQTVEPLPKREPTHINAVAVLVLAGGAFIFGYLFQESIIAFFFGAAAILYPLAMLYPYFQANKAKMEQWRATEAKKKQIRSEIAKDMPSIDLMIDGCKRVLRQMYDERYLHRDYWNLPACATFLEWFQKGMTRSLARDGGDPGAYVMYEEKLRHGEIVGRLDVLSQQLNQIASVQRLLYQEVLSIRQTVDQISGTLMAIENHAALNTFIATVNEENTRRLTKYAGLWTTGKWKE